MPLSVSTATTRGASVAFNSMMPRTLIKSKNVAFRQCSKSEKSARGFCWRRVQLSQMASLKAKSCNAIIASERREGMVKSLFDVGLQDLGGTTDVARQCGLEHLAVFRYRVFSTVCKDQHLVAQIFIIKDRVER